MKNNSWILVGLTALIGARGQAADYDAGMWFGTIRPPLAPPTGEIVDRIPVGDNFTGLTYADQDLLGLGTTPTTFYSIRYDAGSGTSYLNTIATPVAPHPVAAVTDRFSLGNLNYNALTFAAPDLGYGPTILYALREDGATSQFNTVTPAGAYQDRFASGNPLHLLTYTSTDIGAGANLFYYIRQDLSGSYIGTIDPALPGTINDRAILALDNFDGLVFTDTDVGYGANLFYYIRHDGITGQHMFGTLSIDFSQPSPVPVALDRFFIGTPADDFDALTFTTTDLGYGPNLFYYLRSPTLVPEASTSWALAITGMLLGAGKWLTLRHRKGLQA